MLHSYSHIALSLYIIIMIFSKVKYKMPGTKDPIGHLGHIDSPIFEFDAPIFCVMSYGLQIKACWTLFVFLKCVQECKS